MSPSHKNFLTHLNSIKIPQTVFEALESEEWRHAMKMEIDALKKNKTSEVVDLVREKLVGYKWVFSMKYKADGSLERYKSRLVVKGYTQMYGVDYQDTFALVAKMNIVRVLLLLVENFDWNLYQFDVKNAFPYGDLEEEIYMVCPLRFDTDTKKKVCRLKKALYGLKQSPMAWFDKFTKAMLSMGYGQSGPHLVCETHRVRGSDCASSLCG